MTQDTVRKVRNLDGQDLLKLVQQEPVPELDCPEKSRHSCNYKYNDDTLDDVNFEALLKYPDCEACGCSLVVRTE